MNRDIKCPKCEDEKTILEKGKFFCFHCYHYDRESIWKCAKCGKECEYDKYGYHR